MLTLFLAGTPEQVRARGKFTFTTAPHKVTPDPVSTGEDVTFEVATSFPGEDWTGYRWQFLHLQSKGVVGHDGIWLGDDEPIDYSGPNGRNVHVRSFARPGRWKALCVVRPRRTSPGYATSALTAATVTAGDFPCVVSGPRPTPAPARAVSVPSPARSRSRV